jgi:hypothetical protein
VFLAVESLYVEKLRGGESDMNPFIPIFVILVFSTVTNHLLGNWIGDITGAISMILFGIAWCRWADLRRWEPEDMYGSTTKLFFIRGPRWWLIIADILGLVTFAWAVGLTFGILM